jgi:hypothetical protein
METSGNPLITSGVALALLLLSRPRKRRRSGSSRAPRAIFGGLRETRTRNLVTRRTAELRHPRRVVADNANEGDSNGKDRDQRQRHA